MKQKTITTDIETLSKVFAKSSNTIKKYLSRAEFSECYNGGKLVTNWNRTKTERLTNLLKRKKCRCLTY